MNDIVMPPKISIKHNATVRQKCMDGMIEVPPEDSNFKVVTHRVNIVKAVVEFVANHIKHIFLATRMSDQRA